MAQSFLCWTQELPLAPRGPSMCTQVPALHSCNEGFPHSKPATKTKAAKSSEGKAMQCAALTQGKAFTGQIWKKVKGALHIPVSLADGCSSLVLLGRMVLQGSLPSVCGGQHFRINSPQCLRPSCIPSHCTLQSRTGGEHAGGTAEQPKSSAIPPLT